MKYFEIGYPFPNPYICEIIAANNKYEALGYFVVTHSTDIVCVEDIEIRNEYNGDYLIEISCIGFPEYKRLSEMHRELNNRVPVVVCRVSV
jgi:hypothetical protein